jgi:putative ABC transport system permease protein
MSAALRLAIQALEANKLRSVLTMLGNIIGVTALVALVNIGISGRKHIQQSLSAIGQNLVFVNPKYDPDAENPPSHWRPLDASDVQAIAVSCPGVSGVCPEVEFSVTAIFSHLHTSTQVQGVWPNYLALRNWKLSRGTLFTESDVRSNAKVCVLGKKVAEKLFGNMDACGQSIRINAQPFNVLGVLEKKGTLLTGQDQDNAILMPITTAQQFLVGKRSITQIYAVAYNRTDLSSVKDQIKAAVRRSHHLPPGTRDDIDTTDLGQLAAIVDKVMFGATALLSSIAFISLLVGGIGIMNIMLVSVMERTREIGLRMAVGASGGAILTQFLIEAMMLSIIGGILGALLGLGLSAGITDHFAWPRSISGISVLGGVAFSAAIGAFFGLYPAYRASQLEPIAALRNE